MKKRLSCLLLASSTLHAHGPTPKKVQESLEIDASADKVWAVVKTLGDLARWNPAISKSEGAGPNDRGGRERQQGRMEEPAVPGRYRQRAAGNSQRRGGGQSHAELDPDRPRSVEKTVEGGA